MGQNNRGRMENEKNLCKGTSDKDAKILFEKEDCIAYQIQNEEGDLFITEHHIFPF